MGNNSLFSSLRIAEAQWIEDRFAAFGSGVTAIVPSGFEAQARIFHPATASNDKRSRWAGVAAKSGRTMHRLAQFHAIHRSQRGHVDPIVVEPQNGNLPKDLLRALYGALAVHIFTTSPPRDSQGLPTRLAIAKPFVP